MNAIWSIVGGLLGVLVLSSVMVIVIVTHPPRLTPHKTIPPPCVCKCAAKAGAQ